MKIIYLFQIYISLLQSCTLHDLPVQQVRVRHGVSESSVRRTERRECRTGEVATRTRGINIGAHGVRGRGVGIVAGGGRR